MRIGLQRPCRLVLHLLRWQIAIPCGLQASMRFRFIIT
jgi:hypothetical protein